MGKTYKDDIKARAYRYALESVKMIDRLPRETASSIMGKQLLRSATSIGANIVEARAASSRRDFINFLNHALKSANESRFWLELIRDSGKLSPEELAGIIQETKEIANILAASIISLKRKPKF
ncbi:four helix bundle protein [Candidatus Margulisiibacteriota bacterium]